MSKKSLPFFAPSAAAAAAVIHFNFRRRIPSRRVKRFFQMILTFETFCSSKLRIIFHYCALSVVFPCQIMKGNSLCIMGSRSFSFVLCSWLYLGTHLSVAFCWLSSILRFEKQLFICLSLFYMHCKSFIYYKQDMKLALNMRSYKKLPHYVTFLQASSHRQNYDFVFRLHCSSHLCSLYRFRKSFREF